MITVTRFDHTSLIVNADLIEYVESLPDTHITLVTGKKLLVREKAEEVVARVLEYRRAAGPLLRRPETGAHTSAHPDAQTDTEDEN
jgi:flagellar protein FlbD